MPEDIENILNDAAAGAMAQEVMDMPVLPAEHPEVVEFEQCWERMYEIAKKNGWLFCASMVRQHSRDGVQQTGNGFAVAMRPERLAKNFAQFGMPGVLAAQAYTLAVKNLDDFHTNIIPMLFGRNRQSEGGHDVSDFSRYDGSLPEPPYNTDTDTVAMLQQELDAMTAERDQLRAELARLRSAPVAVEAPEIPEWDDVNAKLLRNGWDSLNPLEKFIHHNEPAIDDEDGDGADSVFRNGLLEAIKFSVKQIHPSRILKEGERAVPVELLERISLWLDWNRNPATEGFREEIDALRSQRAAEGGA